MYGCVMDLSDAMDGFECWQQRQRRRAGKQKSRGDNDMNFIQPQIPVSSLSEFRSRLIRDTECYLRWHLGPFGQFFQRQDWRLSVRRKSFDHATANKDAIR